MARATFAVSVVDGTGVEVFGEPVTATIDLGDGGRRGLIARTDVDGYAHFALDVMPAGVTVRAAGECLGPVQLSNGNRLVIEA